MHPFEKQSARLPQGVSAHLDARLKPGWSFDRSHCALVSETGQKISLERLLPEGASILPTVPSLADTDPAQLSDDERVLARCLHVGLPSGSASPVLDGLAAELRSLDGFESVSRPPQLGLP